MATSTVSSLPTAATSPVVPQANTGNTPSSTPAAVDSNGNRRRACEYCGKVCSSSSALLYHTRLHTGERPYVCDVCGKGFIQKVHLQRHLENNHGKSGPIQVQPMSTTPNPTHPSVITASRSLTTSPAILSGTADWPGLAPGVAAGLTGNPLAKLMPGNRLEQLANQLKSKAEMIPCVHCGDKFADQMSMLEHIFASHSDIMQQTMQQWTGAMAAAAMAQQNNTNQNAALLGNLQMLTQANLNNMHNFARSIKNETTPVDSTDQSMSAAPIDDLELDAMEDDDDEERLALGDVEFDEGSPGHGEGGKKSTSRAEPVTCPDCGEQHFGQIAFLEHVFEAHGRRLDDENNNSNQSAAASPPAAANHSPSATNLNSNSTNGSSTGAEPIASPQLTTHQYKRNTWCPHCKKHLSSPTALVVHLRAHSGMKPFTCNMCNKSFMHQNSLKVHLLSHTGAKPHTCPICAKSFTTTRTLKIHMMIHTGERPYGCKFCGRRFIQQIHLLRHIKSHIRRGSSKDIGQDTSSTPTGGVTDLSSTSSSVVPTTHFADTSGLLNDTDCQLPMTTTDGSDTHNSDSHSDNDGSATTTTNQHVDDDEPQNLVINLKTRPEDQANGQGQTQQENNGTSSTGGAGKLLSSTQSNSSSTTSSTTCFDWNLISPNNSEPLQLLKVMDNKRLNNAAKDNSASCLNCQIVENELTMLRTELTQLKAFLGSKLSLMEHKVDSIKRCVAVAVSKQCTTQTS